MTYQKCFDIEKAVIKFLNDNLEKAQAFGEVPNPRPDAFVVVDRTGGNHGSIALDQPLMTIQAWGKSKLKASELAYEVDLLIRSMQEDVDEVTYVDRNSMYYYPDDESHTPRYQMVYDMMTYN